MNLRLVNFLFFLIFNNYFTACLLVRLYTAKDSIAEYPVSSESNLTNLPGFCSGAKCSNYMIIHGFNSFGKVQWALDMKNKLLNVDTQSNVFIVDWSEGVNTGFDYETAVYNLETYVVEVYKIIASFLANEYINATKELLNLHCIGHSLGSHFCGFTSKIIQSQLSLKLKRITGLGELYF